MGQEQTTSMSEISFNLKWTAKQFNKEAKKSEKQISKEKAKVKKAIEKNNLDGANAIRKKNESINYYRLAARMDAVASRVGTAVKMNRVTKAMGGVVKGMDQTLKTMDVDKISHVMDKFEKQFDDLDVRSKYMEDAMQSSTSMTTPEDQVNDLMGQIIDENNLQVSDEIGETLKGKLSTGKKNNQFEAQADDLSARLAKLKGGQL